MKDKSYSNIIKCSMAFSVLYKSYLEQYIEKRDKDNRPIEQQLLMLKNFIPLLSEMSLFSLMGSKKLSAVIRDKINKDYQDKNISDFERFISVFLYADIKGPEYEKYMIKFVRDIKYSYLFDMTLIKIISFYFFSSKTHEMDKQYLNIIADLIIKFKGEKRVIKGKIFEKFRDKSKIIQDYKSKKKKFDGDD